MIASAWARLVLILAASDSHCRAVAWARSGSPLTAARSASLMSIRAAAEIAPAACASSLPRRRYRPVPFSSISMVPSWDSASIRPRTLSVSSAIW